MNQKVFRTGNSLAVTIPSTFAESVGIKAGDKVAVNAQIQKGKIVYQFSAPRQLAFDEDFFKARRRKKHKQ